MFIGLIQIPSAKANFTYLTDTFETGALSTSWSYNSGTPTVTSTAPINGTYSMNCSLTSAQYVAFAPSEASQTTTINSQFLIKVTASVPQSGGAVNGVNFIDIRNPSYGKILTVEYRSDYAAAPALYLETGSELATHKL